MLKIFTTLSLILITNCAFAFFPPFEQKPLPYEYGSITYDVKPNATLMSAFGATNKTIVLFKDYGKRAVSLFYKDDKLLSRMVTTPTEIYSFYPTEKKYSLDTIKIDSILTGFQTIYNGLNKTQKINYQRYIEADEVINAFENEAEIFIPAYHYQDNICKLVINRSVLQDNNLASAHDYNCYLGDKLIILSNTQPIKKMNTEKKPAEKLFNISVPADYTKIDSMAQAMTRSIEQDGSMPEQQKMTPDEFKRTKIHLLNLLNNEPKLKNMEAKAENIINRIKPQMENYMDMVLNSNRTQNNSIDNQQENEQKNKYENNADATSSLEEKAIEVGLDVLGSFF
ncbi:MAG: hypothetical protein ACJAT7_000470 [Psychromonas sp.]|jgi:hypothetical protein|uniref:hypothetical protein n=1 Tax=Psychromonas sp. TaxID=1884585 RepID=UPI0039E5D442